MVKRASIFGNSDPDGFIREPGAIPFCEKCWDWHEPDDDHSVVDVINRIAKHIGLDVGEEKQVKFQGKTWTMRRTQ
jgi:hypothetical protein